MRRLAEAELASARGLRGQALRRVRSGLALVHEHRGRLGSLDMQTGVTALGSDLAAAGLAAALANGSARLVFEWSERGRRRLGRRVGLGAALHVRVLRRGLTLCVRPRTDLHLR